MHYTIEQTDGQLVGTTASIRYTLGFRRAAQHLVSVRMEIDTDAAQLTLGMPVWTPGSYKVRDFISNQGDVRVADARGAALKFEWISLNRLRIRTDGARTVVVSWNHYHSEERSVRTCHIDRWHAFINPSNCLMFVEGRMNERHHVRIQHPWRRVTTALSPVRRGIWGALNYDILVDSPIEIGDHFSHEFTAHGARHEVAITGRGDLDPAWLTGQVRRIVDAAVTRMWGGLPYDRYVFFIQFVPGSYGGLEHARSSVNMYEPEIHDNADRLLRLLNLLCHEFFHAWNVKRIRPAELGPFDYNTGNPTRMLWLAEGFTTYYDKLMTHRSGFLSREEFLPYLTKHLIARHFESAGRRSMSVKDVSYLAWVKFYIRTADSDNRFPNYYIKGGVIAMLLDIEILSGTDGAMSLDKVMLALMDGYHVRPERGVTEREFVRTVRRVTGVDIGERFLHWLNSTDELPIAETVRKIGLRWRKISTEAPAMFGMELTTQAPAPERDMGMTVEDVNGTLTVTKVRRDSAAERAGIGQGDEVIAVDGARLRSKAWFDVLISAAADRKIEVTASGTGGIYRATLRPPTLVRHELVQDARATERERMLFGRWIQR